MRDNIKGGALTEVTFFILLSLYQPKHGYAIMQFVEEKTGGRLVLGAGTLYGALTSLEEKGWIMPCGNTGGRKKEYLITDAGKEVCNKEMIRLNELVKIAEEIMEERHFAEERRSEKSSMEERHSTEEGHSERYSMEEGHSMEGNYA